MMREFLVCDSAVHAELVDDLIVQRLADVDGSKATRWSGVWTDGTSYGIFWDSPVSDLFGDLKDEGHVVMEQLDVNGISTWQELKPEPPESSEL